MLALFAPVGWASDPALEAQLLAHTNEARLGAGLLPLAHDDSLARIARAHAAEMAELNYFSHSSPRAENATLARRAANAGSFAKDLGENLALVGESDPARASVEGWLGSPGHRANLLSPEFTHVGFGTARYPDGRIVVAQEFALAPAVLESATLRPLVRPQLDVLLELTQPSEVAVFFAGTSSRPVTLQAGPQLLHIPLSRVPTLPLEIKVGMRAVGSEGAFSLQGEGTLNTGGWIGGASESALLVSSSLNLPAETGYTATLAFTGPLQFGLTAWQNGVRVPTELSGTAVTLNLIDATTPLQLGVAQTDGRYRVLYSLAPRLSPSPELIPASD